MGKQYSGSELSMSRNIGQVSVLPSRDEDGLQPDRLFFKVSEVCIAEDGPEGMVSLHGGQTYAGSVTFHESPQRPTVAHEPDNWALSYGHCPPAPATPLIAPLPPTLPGLPPTDEAAATFDATMAQHEEEMVQKGISYPPGYAAQVLDTVVNRGSDYGTPADNHQLTADLWNAWLSRRLGQPVKLSAEDVCMLNILQKESRLAFRTKDDSWLDVCGYAENVAMLRRDQRNT